MYAKKSTLTPHFSLASVWRVCYTKGVPFMWGTLTKARELKMEASVKELVELRKYWESHLVSLARLPRHRSEKIQEVRDGRIQYAIERVRDIHVRLCDLDIDAACDDISKEKGCDTFELEPMLWREPHC